LEDPIMDKPLIKQGYMPIEDFEPIEDLPITEDYANTGNNGEMPSDNGDNSEERDSD